MAGKIGNKGGGRMGYTYEREQLQRLRQITDRGIAMIDAIQRGKATPLLVRRYQTIEKALLKALDKLQPNKQQIEADMNITLPTPILANVPSNDSNKEGTPAS